MTSRRGRTTESTKGRPHEIIDELDPVRAEGLLVVLEPSNGGSNGHHVAADRTASHGADRLALIREARATPPDERTPFQDGLVLRADREAELARTPEGRAWLDRNPRDRDRILANDRPLQDHPIRDMVGMSSSDELTDVADDTDRCIAEAAEHGWR